MSIGSSSFQGGGGGASSDTLNDVTGRGATTANNIQVGGLNIAGSYAMPSADGSVNQVLQTDGSGSLSFTTISVTGGLTYKGTYYLSSPADLSNAVQGDFYIIQGDGTLYGKAWITGDHLVVNDDMGGSVSNGKIDKIDNTDIVTSVNALTGPVVLNGTNVDGDHTATNYSTTSDKIEKHFEGIDNKFGTLGTASVKDTGVANGNVIVADATGLPEIDGSQLTGVTGTDATKLVIANNLSDLNNAGTARTNLGLVIGTDVSAIASPAFTGSPTAPTQSAGDDSTKIATTAYVEAAVTAGGGLSSVVQDTSPELGGNLDVLARSIVSSSNRAITLTPDGSGLVEISGNATSGSGQIKLNCEQNTHGIKLKSPPHSATADYTLVFPDDLGTSGKVLTTNGGGGGGSTIGTLTWETVSTTDTTKLAILNNLSDLDNAGTARTNLGLVIGTNVQAYDPGLTSIAGLTTAADKMIFTDGSDSYAVTDLTSAGRALLDDADASAQRTTLGLVIGTDVAPIAAPAFTGNATAVTQSSGDDSTKIATTAYVDAAVVAGGGSVTISDVVVSGDTGDVTAVFANSGTNGDNERVYLINNSANARTVTLPAVSGKTGKQFQIKRLGTANVTVAVQASEKLDTTTNGTFVLTSQYSSVTLMCNATGTLDGWYII